MAEVPIEPTPVETVAPVVTATVDSTKASVCVKTFILPDGERVKHADPTAESLEFAFTNGSTHLVKADDFTDAINGCFAWMGRSEKLGNGYAGARKSIEKEGGDIGELANVAEDMFLTLYEQLGDGDWVKTGEGDGARPSMLVDAIVAALESDGETVDDTRRLTIAMKLKADSAENPLSVDEDGNRLPEDVWLTADKKRKNALANPNINLQYEKIKQAAQDARMAVAEQKAAESTTELSGF